ncbi:hypothetical protein VPH35_037466 [Triticum aestivum]
MRAKFETFKGKQKTKWNDLFLQDTEAHGLTYTRSFSTTTAALLLPLSFGITIFGALTKSLELKSFIFLELLPPPPEIKSGAEGFAIRGSSWPPIRPDSCASSSRSAWINGVLIGLKVKIERTVL